MQKSNLIISSIKYIIISFSIYYIIFGFNFGFNSYESITITQIDEFIRNDPDYFSKIVIAEYKNQVYLYAKNN